jgi:hypothetical protein
MEKPAGFVEPAFGLLRSVSAGRGGLSTTTSEGPDTDIGAEIDPSTGWNQQQ